MDSLYTLEIMCPKLKCEKKKKNESERILEIIFEQVNISVFIEVDKTT